MDIRQASKRYVRTLGLPSSTNIRDLLPEIERRTQRTIHLSPAEVDWEAPCGMWIATERAHYVFYDPRTSRAHQDHIIAHEFAHILKGHKGEMKVSASAVSGVLTLLDPDLIQTLLGRTQYDDREELEAELVGSYMQEHVRFHQNRRVDASNEMAVDRVERTLLRGRES